ncbi:MAG: GNAT family N-acetyltransferase [Ilumatobacteraceae bacterium]
MLPTDFIPPEFVVPTDVTFGDLRLVPLSPERNAADYAAWTSSIEHIRATPGFAEGTWPVAMTIAENLQDVERHAEDFRLRKGFTYTVLDATNDVIGCIYIYPSRDKHSGAQIHSWVRADRADLDIALYDSVNTWLRTDWPFHSIEYANRTCG